MSDSIERTTSWVQRSQMVRILSLGFLALLLQIPILMIGNLVSERQARRDEAVTEVSSKWGNAQTITGPVLVLPYSVPEKDANGLPVSRSVTRYVYFLPERLEARGTVDAETRHRSIFSVPVYQLGLTMAGEFATPNVAELGIDPAHVEWERAHVAVGISDTRAIQEETSLLWNGRRAAFLPGTGGFRDGSNGIYANIGRADTMKTFTFSFPIKLNGSLGLYFTPFGRNTTVDLQADHGHPSFQGNWLPTDRSVTDGSFRARWSIPFLGRNYPQAWTSEQQMKETIETSRFGVDLVDPIDHYRMADRSAKYASLFILFTFVTIWLMEVLAGVRVHPIQYLLLGAALCLFYLLELSLSEHLGFPIAYTVAGSAIVGMVAAYSRVVLQRTGRASIVGVGVTLMYAYLYFLLMNESYALLIGSIGLFVILAGIMYATRRVDWFTVGARTPA